MHTFEYNWTITVAKRQLLPGVIVGVRRLNPIFRNAGESVSSVAIIETSNPLAVKRFVHYGFKVVKLSEAYKARLAAKRLLNNSHYGKFPQIL